MLTAQKLAKARGGYVAQGREDETEKLAHVRGGNYEGMHIHSVRLPGFVASQEIISEAWVNASSSAMIPSTVTATCLVLCWDVGPWLNAGALCMGWMQFCKEAFLI